ncbi:MAG: T9SS type A sorting domain-containing protein [Saprospiraceae bacterium]|nr:T9SS type A sorting domain-containing protein [Candidatus Opimibacter skivensis]MBL0009350.1 T9SS type A sorting domain-containing protein [Candidatus Opimibacter skivensis]MBP8085774.1 T9SS type A sorting domain-containing protein [Saprospiraceae bacterium]
MESEKWMTRLTAIMLLCAAGWGASAQCLISPMISSGYASGDCHGLIFQQSIGSVFTGYGSCGALDFTSPLTESDVISGNAPIESEALVRVYPNPLKDYLFIEAVDFRSGEIRVYSLLGSLVYAGDLNHNRQNNLDLSSLTNGVYLVKVIIDETKCTTYTIIKS